MKRIVSILMALIVAVQPVMTSGEPQEPAETDEIDETVEVQGQVEISSVNGINIFKLPEETDIPEEYQNYCMEIGKQYHICPELLMAMIEQESSGRADVVNILVAADYLEELFQESDGDIYLVLMKYNMKHDAAERLFYTGKFSEYSVLVEHRARELQELHGIKGGRL